jgi:hypothetical protein
MPVSLGMRRCRPKDKPPTNTPDCCHVAAPANRLLLAFVLSQSHLSSSATSNQMPVLENGYSMLVPFAAMCQLYLIAEIRFMVFVYIIQQ